MANPLTPARYPLAGGGDIVESRSDIVSAGQQAKPETPTFVWVGAETLTLMSV